MIGAKFACPANILAVRRFSEDRLMEPGRDHFRLERGWLSARTGQRTKVL